jgi:hypothetical protein
MKAILLGPVCALVALAVVGCNSSSQIDPRTAAAVFCVLSADGVVIAQATTKGGAQASAQKAGAAQPILCDAAVQIGASLKK